MELVGDVAAGMRGAHDEGWSVLKLCRPAVLTGVNLADRRVEIRGEGGHMRRPPEGPGRHHHVVAREAAVAERGRESSPGVGVEAVDSGAHPHGKVEAKRVALQEVGDLLLARERPRLAREPQAG
jgi:hypothetical protein